MLINFNSKLNPTYNISTNVKEVTINAYADFDNILKRCEFSTAQHTVLKLLLAGYNLNDVSDVLKKKWDIVNGIYNSIINKIAETNEQSWDEWVKSSDNNEYVKYKICSMCSKKLRLCDKYFRMRPDSKDGFRAECRKCEISAKKQGIL